MKIRVEYEGNKPEPNLRKMAKVVGDGLGRHWAKSLFAGLQPDGSPLPKNKEGKPMGLGDGTFTHDWGVKKVKSKKKKTLVQAEVVPGGQDDKRYVIAFRDMKKNKGVKFHDISGTAELKYTSTIDMLIAEYVKHWNKQIAKFQKKQSK